MKSTYMDTKYAQYESTCKKINGVSFNILFRKSTLS